MESGAMRIMIRRIDLQTAILLCIGFCFGRVSAVPCSDNGWIEVPFANAVEPVTVRVQSNVSDCQTKCIDDINCTGMTLEKTADSNHSLCYFNFEPINSTNSHINYSAPASFRYFSLLRNYPSCSYQEYNCSFIWMGQRDMHGFDGVDGSRSTLNDCIKLCQETVSCKAVDWNHQDATCWIHSTTFVSTGVLPNITFFAKNCVSPLMSTTKQTTPGPFTTTSTTTTTTTTPTTTTTTMPTTTTTTTSMPTTTTTTTSMPTTTSTTKPTTTSTTTSTTTTTTTPTTTSTTTSTTTTTTAPTTTNSMSTTMGEPSYLSMEESPFAYYPMAIKPAYIVLAGLGGGCLLLVLTAVIILCMYPLHKGNKYATSSTVTTVRTTHVVADNSYVESQEPERLDMDEMAEGDVKTYYNAEEVN